MITQIFFVVLNMTALLLLLLLLLLNALYPAQGEGEATDSSAGHAAESQNSNCGKHDR